MKYTKAKIPFPKIADIRNQEIFRVDNNLGVIKTEDNTPKWGWLKHVSVSHPERYPTWEELLEIKQDFFGDTDCMMMMPKKEDYVNFHSNCFHIWQCPEDWGLR